MSCIKSCRSLKDIRIVQTQSRVIANIFRKKHSTDLNKEMCEEDAAEIKVSEGNSLVFPLQPYKFMG